MLCPDLETLAWWTTKPIEQIDVEAVKHVVPSLERLALKASNGGTFLRELLFTIAVRSRSLALSLAISSGS